MTDIQDVLRRFSFERILSHDTKTKLIFILGTVDDVHCILSFERTQFDDKDVANLPQAVSELGDAVINNIYGWANTNITTSHFNTRLKMIYPATDLHIRKYEHQERYMITETPEVYIQVTQPYITSIPEDRTAWVENILNGSAEADRILWREDDPKDGFVILPDMKWDGTRESLYWVAIVKDPTIRSLRSLLPCHLPMLRKIREKAYELAKRSFSLDANQLRLFVHYQPSYYYFHVHITAITFADAPNVAAGQAHLLDTVIHHLERYPDYYQNAVLPFIIGERHPLFELHKQWRERQT